MRIGLIARADNTGLGVQTHEFYRHMRPAKTLVVDLSARKRNRLHPERYPDAEVVRDFPTIAQFEHFLRDLDVVYTAETPYGHELFSLAANKGVRTVLHYNWEFLDHLQRPHLPRPTIFAAPSTWHYNEMPFENKTLLPVPIATDRFATRAHGPTATHFLHIAGTPALHDRNGTKDLLAALEHVTAPVTVTIRCQDPAYVDEAASSRRMPSNVNLVIDTTDTPNYWDLYKSGDVLVMPRRFGGLCLPVNEALGARMPVIMPAIEPNTAWLPADWLVPATEQGRFMARTKIAVHSTDPHALAAKIDQFATDRDFYRDARASAETLSAQNSWAAMRSAYEHLFESIARG